MDLPTMSAFQFSASSAWSAGVVGALAITAVVALGRTLVLHSRLARRTRELENELRHRRCIEAELETVRDELEARVRERTHALELRNEELTRLRLALETANQRLKRLVAVDALTGIANRRHFDRALDRELRRARREGLPLSLIFLDLDEFKRFNDTYGHARGDDVLRAVAQTLDETFRRGATSWPDMAARNLQSSCRAWTVGAPVFTRRDCVDVSGVSPFGTTNRRSRTASRSAAASLRSPCHDRHAGRTPWRRRQGVVPSEMSRPQSHRHGDD